MRAYITPEELYLFHNVRRFAPPDVMAQKIGAAYDVVLNDLRNKGNDVGRFCVPVNLCAEGTAFTTGTATGTETAAGNALRFCVELSGSFAGTCTVTLQGKSGATWYDIRDYGGAPLSISVTGGLQTALFLDKRETYRYALTTDADVALSIWLVDTSLDQLVRLKAVELASFDVMDRNTSAEAMYVAAQSAYTERLNAIRPDYDADGDGVISDTDQMTRQSVRALR